MKFFSKGKDGGPHSTVAGYWLVELKRLFSVALLRFGHGSRDEYHSHAFNSVSWVIRGRVEEQLLSGERRTYRPSLRPVVTRRDTFHRVVSEGTTWVLTLRGPWVRTWREFDPGEEEFSTLTHGRHIVQ